MVLGSRFVPYYRVMHTFPTVSHAEYVIDTYINHTERMYEELQLHHYSALTDGGRTCVYISPICN